MRGASIVGAYRSILISAFFIGLSTSPEPVAAVEMEYPGVNLEESQSGKPIVGVNTSANPGKRSDDTQRDAGPNASGGPKSLRPTKSQSAQTVPSGGQQSLNPQPIPPGMQQSLNPQPIPPGTQNSLNPQPIPPGMQQSLNPQPIPPGMQNSLNPQPIPPGMQNSLNPQPIPPGMQQSLNPQPIPPGKVQIESVTTKPAMLPASGPSPQIDPPHSNLMRSSRGENDTSIKSMSSEKKDDRKRAAVGTSPQIDPPHSNLGRNTKSLENSQKLQSTTSTSLKSDGVTGRSNLDRFDLGPQGSGGNEKTVSKSSKHKATTHSPDNSASTMAPVVNRTQRIK